MMLQQIETALQGGIFESRLIAAECAWICNEKIERQKQLSEWAVLPFLFVCL